MSTEEPTPDPAGTSDAATGPADPTSGSTGGEVPNPETGAGLGAGEPSTFEPEEDPDAVTEPE